MSPQGEVCEWLNANTSVFILTMDIWYVILSVCCSVFKLFRKPKNQNCCNCDYVYLCILIEKRLYCFLYLHFFFFVSINLCWILSQTLCNGGTSRFILQGTDISLNFHETLKYHYYFSVSLKQYKKKYIKQIKIARIASEIIQANQDILIISKMKQLTLSSWNWGSTKACGQPA